jgi:phospholipid/cholesterol/gamma-HCH transport system ATP-binding protein
MERPIESLRFEESGFAYPGTTHQIFKDLTFDFPMDRNVLITGPVGNGQSTLLKLLAVIQQPQEGKYLVNGEDTTQMSFEEFLPFRRRIGYTFDFGGLFANRSLRANLTLPLLYHNILEHDEANELAMKFARAFSFEKQADLLPASVSGGLRKLVCVVRALILGPEVLVMDDPFTGIDSESSRKLLSVFQERREAGELRHVFFTSRDEVWPARMGADTLIVDQHGFRFEERKAA